MTPKTMQHDIASLIETSIAENDRLTSREEFLRDENSCCLCGETLAFEYRPERDLLIIKEDASCKSCQIRLRSRSYRIH